MRNRNIHIQCWLDEKEAEHLQKMVKRSGLTREAYLRKLINGLIPRTAPPPDYFAMMKALYVVGRRLADRGCYRMDQNVLQEKTERGLLMQAPVTINALELENVKRIKAVQMQPSATGLTVIGGRNGQGKTSVLDAICWALGGKSYQPSSAHRDGSVIRPISGLNCLTALS